MTAVLDAIVPLLPIGTLVKDTRLELALVEEVMFPGIVVVVDDDDDDDDGDDDDDKFPFELG